MSAAVLIVEDEEQLLRLLRSTLIYAGYDVEGAKTAKEALSAAHLRSFDVILLDLGLPDLDGLEVIRQLRTRSDVPIIVISARVSPNDKVLALDLGANDYLAKPFDVGELIARVRVALRNRHPAEPKTTSAKRLELDFKRRRAILDGNIIRLSAKETELLRVLAEAEGEVVSLEQIIEEIWGAAGDSDIMRVRVLTWQARRKIEPDPQNPQFIISEVGLGYRLNVD